MATTLSPLRYPGGKARLSIFVEELMRQNGLLGGTYVEPFAGGAGIAWKLLKRGAVSSVLINDLNHNIYAFWHCVLHRADELCRMIASTDVTIQEWHRQRGVYSSDQSSLLERAFATLFLNRTNRSGILSGGVIGGLAQNGNYKIDCRFNKRTLITKIKNISQMRQRIQVSCIDAKEFLVEIASHLPEKSLINIDPPYYDQGRNLYLDYLENDDHQRLCDVVSALGKPWIATYDNTPEILDLYSFFKTREYGLSYTAQSKRKGKELLILSPMVNDIDLPPDINQKSFKKRLTEKSYSIDTPSSQQKETLLSV